MHGFASLNEANVKLIGDFFSIFDANSYIYLSYASKMEYVIRQIFKSYHNSFFFDMDAVRYSIVKTIVTYRPAEVIESLYKSPAAFVAALKSFLTNRIKRNRENLELKSQENTAFESILFILNDVDVPHSLVWDYHCRLSDSTISYAARAYMIIQFCLTKKEKQESKATLLSQLKKLV